MRSPKAFVAVLLGLAAFASGLAAPLGARADENDDLFASSVKALKDGMPAEAIAGFEALADRGVVDADASFDRGLSYATRVRIGAGQPGDLGQAAHGFEEARRLAARGDGDLADGASRALAIVREEVARRRARAGESVDLDKGEDLGRSIVGLLPEQTWASCALAVSLVLGLALFARDGAKTRRGHIAANVVTAFAAPLLIAFASLTAAARHERLDVKEGVVVSPTARLLDERGLSLVAGAGVVPEGAKVRLLETRASLARIRWGSTDAWIQAVQVRPL